MVHKYSQLLGNRRASLRMEHGNEEVFFFSSKTHYAWEDLYLYKFCPNQIIRRCVPKDEQQDILQMCHEEACGGHFAPMKTSTKILQSRFYWPTMFKDCYTHCKSCPQSQQLGKSTQGIKCLKIIFVLLRSLIVKALTL